MVHPPPAALCDSLCDRLGANDRRGDPYAAGSGTPAHCGGQLVPLPRSPVQPTSRTRGRSRRRGRLRSDGGRAGDRRGCPSPLRRGRHGVGRCRHAGRGGRARAGARTASIERRLGPSPGQRSPSTEELARSSGGGEPLLLSLHIEIGHRPLEVEGAQMLDQKLCDSPVAVPLAVRWNDEPRRQLGAALLKHRLIGLRVGEPSCTLLDVARVVLPVLGGVVEASEQAILLLGTRDVEEALDHDGASIEEVLLPRVDLVIARAPDRLLHQVAHPDDQDVLVMRTIKDADDARRWQLALDSPEKGVFLLLLRRRPESFDLYTLRIDHPDRVPDHPALAGGVHPLQDHQDVLRVCFGDPAGRVEPLLQVAQFGSECLRQCRCVDFGAGEAGGPSGVQGADVHRARRQSKQLGQRLVIASGSAGSTVCGSFLLGAMGRILHYPRRELGARTWQGCGVRLLYDRSDPIATGEISDDRLVELYRHPLPETGAGAVVRTNFVSSLDGSVQGPNGRSGSINTPSDHHVFALHRALSDVILVGAGTVRKEGYRAVDLAPWQRDIRAAEGLSPFPTLAVVSASLDLDPRIATPRSGPGGPVLIVTVARKDRDLDRFRAADISVIEQDHEFIDLEETLAWLSDHQLRHENGQ